MLNWMRSALALKRSSDDAVPRVDPVAAAEAFFGEQIARMPTVWPPEPANDDPMIVVAEAIERELRTAGCLR